MEHSATDSLTVEREAVVRAPKRILVPRTPGRLLPVDQRAHRQRDDLDQMVDELFGEPTEERPGRLDAALVILGLAVLGWGLISGQSSDVFFLGSAVILLGLVLPLRSVRQRIRSRKAARAEDALQARHDVLDAADPTVLDLTTSYAELAAASSLPGVSHGSEALAAGHQAVAEVASLLEGRSPVVPAEVEYVRKRTDAVRRLTSELQRSHQASLESERLRLGEEEQKHRLRALAMAAARGEIHAVDPADSLDELDSLTQRLRQENRGAGSKLSRPSKWRRRSPHANRPGRAAERGVEPRPDTLAMRTLAVVLAPIVLTYLAVRWTWSKLPVLLRAVGRLAGQIGHRIALVLRGAASLVSDGLHLIRSIAIRVLVLARSAASAVARAFRPLLAAVSDFLSYLARLARAFGSRAFVVIRAGVSMLLRPVRWLAAVVGQLWSRALVVLRAAAQTINRGLRSVAGVARQLGARAALLALAAARGLMRPVRVLLGAIRAGVDMIAPRISAFLRMVGEPIIQALAVVGRLARSIALAALALGRRTGRVVLDRLTDAKNVLVAWYQRFLRPPMVLVAVAIQRRMWAVGTKVVEVGGRIRERVATSARRVSRNLRAAGSQVRASANASARQLRDRLRFG